MKKLEIILGILALILGIGADLFKIPMLLIPAGILFFAALAACILDTRKGA